MSDIGRLRHPVLSPLEMTLLEHHPVMHSVSGPLAGCRCGAVFPGQNVIVHVAREVRITLGIPLDQRDESPGQGHGGPVDTGAG